MSGIESLKAQYVQMDEKEVKHMSSLWMCKVGLYWRLYARFRRFMNDKSLTPA